MNLDRAVELRRLAQVLHRQPGELNYLQALDGHGLMQLRTLVQNRLLDQFSDLFQKMAAAGRIAPHALSALLCRKVFGASITANMSYYVSTETAVGLCRHFDERFMADIARELIPERAQVMLQNLPVELMKGVMRQMLGTREFPVMGGFTDYLPEDKAMTLMREIKDPGDCIRISLYAQRKERIARLTCAMDDARLMQLITAGFTDPELIHELGQVTAEMSAGEQQRMARLTDAVDPAYRQRSRELAQAAGQLERMQAYFAA